VTYLLGTMFALTAFHFVYESTLAPSFRLQLRFELFRLRDELRNLKMTRNDLDDKHFCYLQDSINTLIANLVRFDAATLTRIDLELQRDSELRERSEARCKVMDDCAVAEARLIRRKCNIVGVKALAVNSGGWGGYILPGVFVLVGFSELKRRIKAALSIPEKDFARAAPPDPAISTI
jgi:hypothetical protein